MKQAALAAAVPAARRIRGRLRPLVGVTIAAVAAATSLAPGEALAASYADTVNADAPSAYYRLGEVKGALVANDTSVNNRDGTYVSGTLGVPGGTTDGDTAVVTPTMVASFTGDDQSIEFWARNPTESGSGPKIYLSHGTDVNGVPTAGWVLELSRADQRFHLSYVDAVGQLQNVTLGCQTPDGSFHHYVITIGYAFKCYRDGVLESSSSASPGETTFVRVSARTGQFAVKAPATVDEVAIYTRVLADSEILEHFNAGLQPYLTGAPRLSGNLHQYSDLDATTGTWRGTNLTFQYSWRRCTGTTAASCTVIPAANNSWYELTADDVGKRVAVTVEAANSHGVAIGWSAITGEIQPDFPHDLPAGQFPVSLDWTPPVNPGPSEDLEGDYRTSQNDELLGGSYQEGEGGDGGTVSGDSFGGLGRGKTYSCYIKAYYPYAWPGGSSGYRNISATLRHSCSGTLRWQQAHACLQKLTDTGWKNYDCAGNRKEGAGTFYIYTHAGECRTGHWKQVYFGSTQGMSGKWLHQSGETPPKVIRC